MAGTLAKLLVSLGLDSESFSKGLDGAAQQANGLAGKITGFLGDVALGTAVAGVAAVGGAFVAAIGNAQEAQDVFAQTEAVIKSTGGAAGLTAEQMGELAGSLSAAEGMSTFGDDAILQGENLLATFTEIKDPVFKDATAAMVDMAAALKTDVSSGAIQLGKALNDPVAGINALSRVGVSFTDQQKKVVEQLVATGDVAGAQKIILAELNKEFGGSAAAAASTFSGKIATLKDKFGELLEAAGTKLLPVLTMVIDTLNSPQVQAIISNLVDGVFNGITDAITYLIPLVTTLAIWFQNDLPSAINAVIAIAMPFIGTLQTIAGFIQANLIPILAGLAAVAIAVIVPAFITWATTATATATATIAALLPILVPLALIGGVVALLVKAWQGNWFGIRDTLTGVWNSSLKPIFDQVVAWLQKYIPIAIEAAKQFLIGTLIPALQQVWSFIQTSVIPILKDIFAWLKVNVPIAIDATVAIVNTYLIPAFKAIWGFISNTLVPIIKILIEDAIKIVTTTFRLLGEVITNVVVPAATKIGDYISTKLQPIFTSIHDFIQAHVTPILQALADKLSGPLSEAGNTVTGIFEGVSNAIDAIGGAISSVLGWIQKMIDAFADVHVPSVLEQHSPSELEQAIIDVGGAAKFATDQIPLLNDALQSMQKVANMVLPDLFSGIPTQGSSDPFNLAGLKAKLPTTNSGKNVSINATIDARGADKGAGDRIKDAFKQIGNSLGNDVDLRIRLGAT